MSHIETLPTPDVERESAVEDALIRAGLHNIEAPKRGTKAYDRLLEAAANYVSEVKKGEQRFPAPPAGDAENYFSKRKPSSASDSARREYHHQLAMMLLGTSRTGLSDAEAAEISDFAAYVTGHEEYVGTFNKNGL